MNKHQMRNTESKDSKYSCLSLCVPHQGHCCNEANINDSEALLVLRIISSRCFEIVSLVTTQPSPHKGVSSIMTLLNRAPHSDQISKSCGQPAHNRAGETQTGFIVG